METFPQSRTKLVSATSSQLMETFRRHLGDLLQDWKSKKRKKKISKSSINIACAFTKEMSRRHRGDVSRQSDNQFAQKSRRLRDVFLVAATSPRRLRHSRRHLYDVSGSLRWHLRNVSGNPGEIVPTSPAVSSVSSASIGNGAVRETGVIPAGSVQCSPNIPIESRNPPKWPRTV